MCMGFLLYRSPERNLESNSGICMSYTDLTDFTAALGVMDVEGFNDYEGDGYSTNANVTYYSLSGRSEQQRCGIDFRCTFCSF